MKAYPVVLTPATEGGFTVYVPDFNVNTEGEDIGDALYMARDAISMVGCYNQDKKNIIPEPSNMKDVQNNYPDKLVLMVDIDLDAYRRRTNNKAIKKNCTIPSWLNEEATARGINFSAVLQSALKKELGI